MTWEDNAFFIDSYLQANGYTPVFENRDANDAPQTQRDHAYDLMPIGADITLYSGDGFAAVYYISLDINYTNITNEERDKNFISFIDLCKGLNKLNGFVSFDGKVNFVDRAIGGQETKGSIKFNFGIEGAS